MKAKEAAAMTPEEIGTSCSHVVASYAKPNVNARTMLSMSQFWTDIAKAMRGEYTTEATTPVLASLEPNTAEVGSANLTVRALGTGFTSASVIVWNNSEEPTTFVSETELTTLVKPSTASGAVDVPVNVRTGEVYSDPIFFSFTAAPEEEEVADEAGTKSKKSKRY